MASSCAICSLVTAVPGLSLLIWGSFGVPAQGPNRISGMALPAQILAALDKNARAPEKCEMRPLNTYG